MCVIFKGDFDLISTFETTGILAYWRQMILKGSDSTVARNTSTGVLNTCCSRRLQYLLYYTHGSTVLAYYLVQYSSQLFATNNDTR